MVGLVTGADRVRLPAEVKVTAPLLLSTSPVTVMAAWSLMVTAPNPYTPPSAPKLFGPFRTVFALVEMTRVEPVRDPPPPSVRSPVWLFR